MTAGLAAARAVGQGDLVEQFFMAAEYDFEDDPTRVDLDVLCAPATAGVAQRPRVWAGHEPAPDRLPPPLRTYERRTSPILGRLSAVTAHRRPARSRTVEVQNRRSRPSTETAASQLSALQPMSGPTRAPAEDAAQQAFACWPGHPGATRRRCPRPSVKVRAPCEIRSAGRARTRGVHALPAPLRRRP
jgi:hypothetical protein